MIPIQGTHLKHEHAKPCLRMRCALLFQLQTSPCSPLFAAPQFHIHYGFAQKVQIHPNFSKRSRVLQIVGMGVLPAQASAVPCKRTFSSSKEMASLRCANMSPWKMEELQFFKFGYRFDRLTFPEHLVSTEGGSSVLDLSISVVDNLISRGKLDVVFAYKFELQEVLPEQCK